MHQDDINYYEGLDEEGTSKITNLEGLAKDIKQILERECSQAVMEIKTSIEGQRDKSMVTIDYSFFGTTVTMQIPYDSRTEAIKEGDTDALNNLKNALGKNYNIINNGKKVIISSVH